MSVALLSLATLLQLLSILQNTFFSTLKVDNFPIMSEIDITYLMLNLVFCSNSGNVVDVIPCPASHCFISGRLNPIGYIHPTKFSVKMHPAGFSTLKFGCGSGMSSHSAITMSPAIPNDGISSNRL